MKLLIIAALAACGPKPSAPTTKPAPLQMSGDVTCPLEVAGTSISPEDTDGGAAFVFVTTGDVASVRARAAKLADAHNARTAGANGELAPACNGCMADTLATPSTAAKLDIDGGAKVVFTATKPDAAADLQAQVKMHGGHLSHMGGGTCKMGM